MIPVSTREPARAGRSMKKVCIAVAAEFLILAALLFGAAGTFAWPAAWAFLIILFAGAALITRMLARDDPALLEERLRPPIQSGQPLWDKIIMASFIVLFIAWLILMGLDAARFGWSIMPVWLQWIGAAGLAGSFWISYATFAANAFLANVVRIQTERGQTVVSSGPYAVIRHPLYAGALLFFASTALLLGSWFGLAGALALGALLILRTVLEDRELHRRLEGYADYARRVRYRLLPRVW
ncbi:Isoprenylcysteine carboxyl methyltransferase [Methylocella tundrae]|uniref:Isoprenylcysteine carboxyl methyltransferase n=2 Tax=Methylocella tundrae TaxID=227605 RepID=A0A8B6M9Z8_METTU|nr:Isoprenylcysteine carboxyl methyltransferase [Methylocella tundrae]VTZ51115.1 Isoprenylcysteine carboxyl methyltransferase [Methylocella tundrae]